MNEKTIEKSFDEYMKKNYTENYLSDYKREVIDNQRCDFTNGVEYYLKNTWHDKSEIPEYGRKILVNTKSYGLFVGGENLSEKDYKTFVKEAEVESWAYVEDLLTNKQEE